MVRRLTSVFLAAWAICTPADNKPGIYRCDVPCFKEVSSVDPINCSRVIYNADLARRVLVEHGEVPAAQVCSKWRDTTVVVTPNYFVTPEVVGVTDVWGHIRVGNHMDALAHEMLHVVDGLLRYPPTLWHWNWDKNGHNATSDDYDSRVWRYDDRQAPKGGQVVASP